jgi:putative DNA primase/helicase
MPYIDVKEVKAQAAGKWSSVLGAIAPALADAIDKSGRHVPCPVHIGKNGDGFRLFKNFNDTGGGCCNTCGKFPDGFKLLQWVTGDSFHEVLTAVAKELGTPSVPSTHKRLPPPAPPKQTTPEDPGIRLRLRSVYNSSLPIGAPDAKPARLYLQNRGLSLVPPMLRVHPALWWFDAPPKPGGPRQRHGPFPTLLSLVVDPEGRGVTLHRIYLTPDGRKAPVSAPKKLMSHPMDVSLHGSAIRLFPAGKVLGVAEGVEKAIAVTEATSIPCWATISSTFLATFVPPAGVEEVIVFADKDRPTAQFPEGAGYEAAKTLVRTLRSKGFKASIALPPSEIPEGAQGVDWLDEFVKNGCSPFSHILAA